MASRRTRLKAVINLPVRRAREGGSSSSGASEKLATESPQNKEGGTKLPKEEVKEIDVGKDGDTLKSSVCANKRESVDTDKNVRIEVVHSVNLKSPEHTPANKTGGCDVRELLPPPTLAIPVPVRKRVKPIVSLSALTRKPKELALENDQITKDIDAKNVKEISSTAPEKSSELPVDVQRTLSVTISDSLNKVHKHDSVPSCSQTSLSGFLPTHSSLNSPLQSKLRADNNKLSSNRVFSKPKSQKLTPRLVDSSNRRSNHSEVEDPLKVLPSITQNVADLTATRLTHGCTPTQESIPETDDELETSSLYSFSGPQINQPLGKNTTAPSVTSTVYEDNLELDDGPLPKVERRPQTHRRPRKSGVGEILTVARRDFFKKFGSNTPDKKQLTMFDLIFYNPTSNPMKHENKPKFADEKPNSRPTTDNKSADIVAERIAEESVDDVDPLGDEVSAAVPAPQVKVGPDGSLIIDEKSLVIATTGSQKRKFELANSSVVVDYGLGNATYNSFSKKVKPKEWSRKETLKFYRALQAVGTDFLLMKSIFPTRTRGDLKQKYKKEDRMNRDLVDKALRNPLEFDLTALEKELEQEGKENEKEQQRLADKKRKYEENMKKKVFKRKGVVAFALMDDITSTYDDDDDVEVEDHANVTNLTKRKLEKKPKTKKSKKKSKKLESDSSTSNDEESDINPEILFENTCKNVEEESSTKKKVSTTTIWDSDEDQEECFLHKSPQPTRYGRVPRARSLSNDASVMVDQQDGTDSDQQDDNTDNDVMTENANLFATTVTSLNAQPSFNITSLRDVEPGSLVILSTPGQKTLQLFMVAPKSQNSTLTHIPVAITPEILASVNNSISELASPVDTPIDLDYTNNSNRANEET